ncbi:MAG: hypothetical protein WBI07_00815 [Mobilitalea sp.]
MKQGKKILALALAVVMVFSLAGCSTSNSDNTSGSNTAEVTKAAEDTAVEATTAPVQEVLEGKYPAETIKIGFVTFDTTADQFISVKKYYEYLAETLNIEVMYSESIDSAEAELAFIESCASAGCKAIVGYYNVARTESIQLAIDKGMYYVGVAEEDEVYEAFKDNEYYLGGYYLGNGDYDLGYELGTSLADSGCKSVVYVSGGRDFGIKMFIDRSEGFYAAIADAQANGSDIVIAYDVSGWPGTDSYSADQAAALDMDIDGVGCSFGAATWLQPIENVGKTDTIKIASNDVLSEMYASSFEAGSLVCLTVEMPGMFGLAVPLIINAVEGNNDNIRDNGAAPRVPMKRWVIKSADEFNAYYEIETTGIWTYNAADVLSVIKGYNPDASFESLCALYAANSIEEIEARRAAE